MSVLFLFTCILYCFAFLLLREAFLRMRIPSNYIIIIQETVNTMNTEDDECVHNTSDRQIESVSLDNCAIS